MHAPNIYVQNSPNPVDAGQEYARQRIYAIFYDHKEKLADKFLREDKPATYGEARKWIEKGKFQLDIGDTYNDDTDFNSFDWTFRWGTKPRDEKGYDAAMEELHKARTHAYDIILTLTDETKRYEALKAFEAWTH